MTTVEIVVRIKLPDGHTATLTREEAERLASDIRLSLGKCDMELPAPGNKFTTYPPYYWEERLDHLFRPWDNTVIITCNGSEPT